MNGIFPLLYNKKLHRVFYYNEQAIYIKNIYCVIF